MPFVKALDVSPINVMKQVAETRQKIADKAEAKRDRVASRKLAKTTIKQARPKKARRRHNPKNKIPAINYAKCFKEASEEFFKNKEEFFKNKDVAEPTGAGKRK